MTILAATESAEVRHCGWQELAATTEQVDTLIVDAPFSERTHNGHDAGLSDDRFKNWAKNANAGKDRNYEAKRANRRKISYPAWGPGDVIDFVGAWAPKTRGWFCSLTDHVLAPIWETALSLTGRVTFAPIPCVEIGSRCRLTGDGPSSWTVWLIVARPRTPDFVKWGTLGGAYVSEGGGFGRLGEGDHDRARVIGGKTLRLMERIVQDYSRPGDLVCDPCCGGGTTLIAALRQGRRALGCDSLEEHAKLSAEAVTTQHMAWRARHARKMKQASLNLETILAPTNRSAPPPSENNEDAAGPQGEDWRKS